MNDIETIFKTSCLKSLAILWPEGVSPIQHREGIRVFSMGFVEALKGADNSDEIKALCPLLYQLAEGTWLPDESWRWWNEKSVS